MRGGCIDKYFMYLSYKKIMFNKEVYITRRKKLKENFKNGIILIMGNDFSPLDCKDNCYPFLQDATFRYYFGIDHPGLIGIIDVDKSKAKQNYVHLSKK